jgi:hypothetical protein
MKLELSTVVCKVSELLSHLCRTMRHDPLLVLMGVVPWVSERISTGDFLWRTVARLCNLMRGKFSGQRELKDCAYAGV